MALNTGRNRTYEGLQAAPALALALFEQSGLRELVDSKFDIDPRTKLTPGNAMKAMFGPMFSTSGRSPLFTIRNMYRSAPVDLMFGRKVDFDSLGARAFDRNLDALFGKDLGELSYECYRKLCGFYLLDSSVYNIDMTNFGVTSLTKLPDIAGAKVPERCGHAKDGHNERLVYSLLSITDGNGIVCYERPYDGSTTDGEMDRDAIEFLSGKADPSESVLIADCKIVTMPLISSMVSKGFGFVSKCPENFGGKIKSDIVYSVKNGIMGPSSARGGWEVYDTDADVNGTGLRFVAYRTTEDVDAGIGYLRDQGGKEARARFARFESRTFNCDVDARRALDEVLCDHTDSAYDASWSIDAIEVSAGYGRRGRPRKGEKPMIKTEYRANVGLEFNEDRARRLSQDRGVRVLVTNLPRANADAENIRFGATADTVLLSYLGQYRIEHAFRLMKDGLGIDRVYLHRPSRENAMMFVISIAAMVWDAVDAVLRDSGFGKTLATVIDELHPLTVVHDRGRDEEFFEGDDALIGMFLDCAKVLGVDVDRIF